jgi:hypothetical protein
MRFQEKNNIFIFTIMEQSKIFEYKTPSSWCESINKVINLIITEVPSDSFSEQSIEIQSLLTDLIALQGFISIFPEFRPFDKN